MYKCYIVVPEGNFATILQTAKPFPWLGFERIPALNKTPLPATLIAKFAQAESL